MGCAITRQYDPALAMCPVIDCSDTTDAETNHAILAAACTPGGACCFDEATQNAFHVMMAYHDICDHDDVPQYVEVAVRCCGDRSPACASVAVRRSLVGWRFGVECLTFAACCHLASCVNAGARL